MPIAIASPFRALQENNIPEVRAHGRAPLTQICLQNGILFNCTSLSNLGSVNRSNIAEAIPRLADQLVVLVSKTQWLNEMEAEMERSTGVENMCGYITLQSTMPNPMKWSAMYALICWCDAAPMSLPGRK